MLAAEEWCTGAAVFTDVLDPEVLEHVERDVETFIRAFDEGYEPPSSPGSLTSGEGTPSNQIFPWSVFVGTVRNGNQASPLKDSSFLTTISSNTPPALWQTTGTFWMPLERTRDPRNGVERAVACLAASPALRRAGLRLERIAGVEWWIQDVAPDEPPKVFHTDCDMQTARSDEVGTPTAVHPAVGGVLYLGDSGGATAVFGQTRRPICGGGGATSLRPRFPREIAVVHPRRNRLLLFEGDRYHAVLSPSAPPTNITGQRVTLLVNWWTARPNGPSDLPEQFCGQGMTLPEACTDGIMMHNSHKWLNASSGTLRGCESVRASHFFEHIEEWRSQRLPGSLAALGPGKALLIQYEKDEVSDEEVGVEELEWPYADL